MNAPSLPSTGWRPPAATVPDWGHVTVGPVIAIPVLMREFGLDPKRLIASAGLHADVFSDGANRAPLDAIGRLLDECARLSGCAHFGLLVGERCELEGFGALGELMRHCENLDLALHTLVLYLQLNDRGAVALLLKPDAQRALLGYSVFDGGMAATDQIYDTVIAIGFRVLRLLGGAAWTPFKVSLAHSVPADTAPYRKVFGVLPRFDAELSAIEFPAHCLEHRIIGADAARHAELATAIRMLAASEGASLGYQVRRALQTLVVTGSPSTSALARQFALHERSLRRQLQAEGTNVKQLVKQARFEVAKQLLRDTRLPVAAVAAALRYADVTAFTRAFRGWAGTTPGAWRSIQCAPLAAPGAPRSIGKGF